MMRWWEIQLLSSGPYPIYRGRGTAAVCPMAGTLIGTQQGGANLLPHSPTPAEMLLDRGDGDLRHLE